MALSLGVMVAAVCTFFAVRGIEPWRIRYALERSHLWLALPFVLTMLLFYRLKAARWALLLRPQVSVRGNELFPAVMIGYAGNTIVPMQFGDLLRAGLVARSRQLATAPVLISIVLERFCDLISLLLPLSIVLLLGAGIPEEITYLTKLVAAVCLAAVGVCSCYLFMTKRFLAFIEQCGRILPAGLSKSLLYQLRAGVTGLDSLRNGRLFARVLAISIIHWCCFCFAVYVTFQALHVEAPPVAALFVTSLLVIGANLPNSPGYVGSIQLAFVLGLKAFGVERENALAASVFFHLLTYPTTVLVGLTYLQRSRLSWRQIRAALPGGSPATTPSSQSH